MVTIVFGVKNNRRAFLWWSGSFPVTQRHPDVSAVVNIVFGPKKLHKGVSLVVTIVFVVKN